MSTTEIKSELQQMIEREMDEHTLRTIHSFLQKTSLNTALRERLIKAALLSEEDIQNGRVFTEEEVIKRTSR
ncbi:MAG TPA: hypothetical protein VFE57_13480 [Cyclobacteriaceae bacterium]|jgi:predicted transcriptional regulator|nr:hypothetical protein [Cyclobacteriaceae bacterium]